MEVTPLGFLLFILMISMFPAFFALEHLERRLIARLLKRWAKENGYRLISHKSSFFSRTFWNRVRFRIIYFDEDGYRRSAVVRCGGYLWSGLMGECSVERVDPLDEFN